jgi:hypothetical protein
MVSRTEPSGDNITVFPTVSNWPLSQFKEFKEFANSHAGGTYWVAITLLLERSKRLEAYEGKQFFSEPTEIEQEQEEEKPLTLGD